jgi:spectinomycin phosphotransferase
MLERPDIPDDAILTGLRDHYGLNAARIEFLPLGADVNTAVFRADAVDDTAYFVRLRGGSFDDLSIHVPKWLHDHGLTAIIPPLEAHNGALWADLGGYKLAVFPFIAGDDAYTVDLLDRHWIDLGGAVRALHMAQLPPAVIDRLPRESYRDDWRRQVEAFQQMTEDRAFADPIAAQMAAFVRGQRAVIDDLVRRARDRAAQLQAGDVPLVLCHGDLHAGNVLIDRQQRLYVVDWDTLILAPKERDLMAPGGGLFASRRAPEAEEHLFYRGYGPVEIDRAALVYYRCERIVQDIAAYCQEILLTEGDGADRRSGLRQLMNQFAPGEVVSLALESAL